MRQTQRALAAFPVRGFGFVPLADSANASRSASPALPCRARVAGATQSAE